MIKKLGNFSESTIKYITLFVLLIYLISISYYSNINIILPSGIIIIFLLTVFYKIVYKKAVNIKNDKKIYFFIFIFSFIIYLLWALYSKTIPTSDYEVLINGAKRIISGNFSELSFDKTNYFYFFNFQIGYVLYLSIIMKLLGQKLILMILFEIIIQSISNVLVYKILSKLYDKKVAILAAIIYATLLFNVGGSAIINNQHISMLFLLLSINFYLKNNDKLINYIFCGLFLSLSYITRQTSIIFLISYICAIICNILKNNKHVVKANVIKMLIIIISFIIPTYLVNGFTMVSGLSPNGFITNNAKYFKFISGIKGAGMYGIQTTDANHPQYYYDLQHDNFDYEKYNENCVEFLKKEYRDPATYKFIFDKVNFFMSGIDNQISYIGTKSDSFGADLLKKYGYIQYVLLLIFCFLRILKSKKISSKSVLFEIAFIGYFMIYLLAEAQTRYKYEQYFILVLIACPLISYMLDYFNGEKNLFSKYH